jgi:hypothetical protein
MVTGSARLELLSDCNANYIPDDSSERASCVKKKEKYFSNIRKLKSGYGHQRGARHQDELAD